VKLLGIFKDNSCFRFGTPGWQSVVHFIELHFVWYDLWIGVYASNDRLYVCLLPTLPIVIKLPPWKRKRKETSKP
jgi:hypothetical protein